MYTLNSRPASKYDYRKPVVARSGLHRLFAAAIVSDQFRAKLLSEPEAAMKSGYLGQPFVLTEHEKKIIKDVQAKNLTDFAQKVNQALKGNQTPA
jgi:2-hydroxychromene-2-carboxylate isomerase